jgi:hypothetical protein
MNRKNLVAIGRSSNGILYAKLQTIFLSSKYFDGKSSQAQL